MQLTEVQALQTATDQALRALLPVRDAYPHTAPEYTALNRIINAAVDVADKAAREYVTAHIIPAPANPVLAFSTRMRDIADDLANGDHLRFEELRGVPVTLTGRTYVSVNGACWWEIEAADELNGPEWVTADVVPDPRGFSSKYEHASDDQLGSIL